ncbi:MAG: hypothetical protein PHQ23_17705, partial [Candidatus Wallbacteria bacterium]|nr:hypothetical protein [Candidatus Wallbacteria bacterium]
NWLKQDGFLLYDDLEIVPVGNSRHDYPADLDSFFSSQTCRTDKTSAMAEAIRQGDARMQNVFLLRRLNRELHISLQAWEKSFRENFRPEAFEKNWEIFSS